MLPVAIGGIGTISGFIAGYYYNDSAQPMIEQQINCDAGESDRPIITKKTLIVLKKFATSRNKQRTG